MLIKTLATVGRISNLPTVWTNIFAATIVAQTIDFAQIDNSQQYNIQIIIAVLALSCMYIGGMFLNDAFDSEWDRENNNMRPTVNGEISLKTVWLTGWALLLSGFFLVLSQDNSQASLATLILGGSIILYNALHKKFPSAAFIMGLTRFGVYIISALLLAKLSTTLMILASALLLYITGITYLARQEQANSSKHHWSLILLSAPLLATIGFSYTLPLYWLVALIFTVWVSFQIKTKILATTPNVRAGIGGLLAAIPLVDGLYLASVNALMPCIICIMVFLLVPRLHKYVSGT